MNKFRFCARKYRYICGIGLGVIVSFASYFPIRIAIAAHQAPYPQAILVLGGDPNREKVAAKLAYWHPTLPVWVSSAASSTETEKIFRSARIPDNRLHIDNRAIDTVTNFTTLVKDFQQQRFQNIYLVTSDYHMPRATAIATVVLGSRGIAFTPISVTSQQPREPVIEVVRDSGRSLLWLFTKHSGSAYRSLIHRE